VNGTTAALMESLATLGGPEMYVLNSSLLFPKQPLTRRSYKWQVEFEGLSRVEVSRVGVEGVVQLRGYL
jgi:hypothetical protein